MRKIICGVIGAAMALCCVPFSACEKTAERCEYVITAEYFPAERSLSASMQVTVPNTTEAVLDALKFELWANAFREDASYKPVSDLYKNAAYYAGESYGGIEIVSVEGAAGYEIGGEDGNILSVSLSKPLYPDESVTLSVGFTVTLAEVNHRLGVGENNVTLANFYPVLCAYDGGFLEYVYAENGDPFVGECADYSVTLTLPEEYTAICSGPAERTEEGGKATYHVSAERVRDVAFVLGTELKTLTQTVALSDGEVTVAYAYGSDPTPEVSLAAAVRSLSFYSETFGDYPYSCYSVVETDFPYGGMEYSGLTLISSSLVQSDYPMVIAHETAHQWWYAAVGSNQFEAAWQDEGLAEYSTALFLDAYPEYGDTYADFVHRCENSYRAFFSVKSQLAGEVDTSMTRPLTSFSGAYEYRSIAYDKGVILFDRVRSVTGERKFLSALQTYWRRYSFRIASPEDLISCFGSAGSTVEGLFYSFLEGTCVI